MRPVPYNVYLAYSPALNSIARKLTVTNLSVGRVVINNRGVCLVTTPTGQVLSGARQDSFSVAAWAHINERRELLKEQSQTNLVYYVQWEEYRRASISPGYDAVVEMNSVVPYLTNSGRRIYDKACDEGVMNQVPYSSGASAIGMFLKWNVEPVTALQNKIDLLILCDWAQEEGLVQEARVDTYFGWDDDNKLITQLKLALKG